MVMELVEGEDAFEAVQRGVLSPERVLEVGRDALMGLSFAHEAGVIHRDIKPSNIMIDATGLVKVLDFGVARSDFSGRESQTRELQFGSVEYMAPERLFFEPETPASDIYSLTLTLYECLATRPFGKVSPKREIHEERLQEKLDVLMLMSLPMANQHNQVQSLLLNSFI